MKTFCMACAWLALLLIPLVVGLGMRASAGPSVGATVMAYLLGAASALLCFITAACIHYRKAKYAGGALVAVYAAAWIVSCASLGQVR
ncbi:hypothetical protein D3C87_820960 [compost metagenome]|nr:hypothetical protein [Stenotrophomonas sp.]